MPKIMFPNREEYRIFIKGCKIYLKEDDSGCCPFETAIISHLKTRVEFNDPESCLKYCGQIFPEIIEILGDNVDGDCPCNIAIGDDRIPSIEREDMIRGLVRTRVEAKLKEAFELYKENYLQIVW